MIISQVSYRTNGPLVKISFYHFVSYQIESQLRKTHIIHVHEKRISQAIHSSLNMDKCEKLPSHIMQILVIYQVGDTCVWQGLSHGFLNYA